MKRGNDALEVTRCVTFKVLGREPQRTCLCETATTSNSGIPGII